MNYLFSFRPGFPNYQFRIKTLLPDTLQDAFIHLIIHGGSATEYPEIFPVGGSDNGEFVVFSKIDDPVVTTERSEK